MRYPVTLTPDDGQFTVTFPDVPEAITFGATKAEALAHAVDALLTVFDAFMVDKRAIPEPSEPKKNGFSIEVPVVDSAKIHLYRAMLANKITKAELGKRLKWHQPQVDRVLKFRHLSRFAQVEDALRAVGKSVEIVVRDVPPVHAGVLAAASKKAAPVKFGSKKR